MSPIILNEHSGQARQLAENAEQYQTHSIQHQKPLCQSARLPVSLPVFSTPSTAHSQMVAPCQVHPEFRPWPPSENSLPWKRGFLRGTPCSAAWSSAINANTPGRCPSEAVGVNVRSLGPSLRCC